MHAVGAQPADNKVQSVLLSTMPWYHLQTVTKWLLILQDVDMPSDSARESVEGMCMLFHTSVRTLAQDFLTQLQRHYYATPTSYLELISTYKQLLAAKRTQVYTLKHR